MNNQPLYKSNFDNCPLTQALNLIGGKWRLPIIKELEADGIINRKQFMEIPPRVEYSLTESGVELIPALQALARWGSKMRKAEKSDQD